VSSERTRVSNGSDKHTHVYTVFLCVFLCVFLYVFLCEALSDKHTHVYTFENVHTVAKSLGGFL